MKIIAYDIDYDITDSDIEESLDAVLEITDLVNYNGDIVNTDLQSIIIDKSIYDAFQTDYPILIGFADKLEEIAYLYQMDSEDNANIYAHQCTNYTYDELRDSIIESLDQTIEFELSKEEIADMNEEDLDNYICDLISDHTDYLLSGFAYDIIED